MKSTKVLLTELNAKMDAISQHLGIEKVTVETPTKRKAQFSNNEYEFLIMETYQEDFKGFTTLEEIRTELGAKLKTEIDRAEAIRIGKILSPVFTKASKRINNKIHRGYYITKK